MTCSTDWFIVLSYLLISRDPHFLVYCSGESVDCSATASMIAICKRREWECCMTGETIKNRCNSDWRKHQVAWLGHWLLSFSVPFLLVLNWPWCWRNLSTRLWILHKKQDDDKLLASTVCAEIQVSRFKAHHCYLEIISVYVAII